MPEPNAIPLILEKLTCQEMKVLILVSDGFTVQEIATKMNISKLTIKTHKQNIAHKAKVKGAAAIRKFVREATPYLKNTPFILL
jgi:DNA-binding NarL/FixJ family response regulator